MNYLNNFFSAYIRPFAVFGVSFFLVAMGSVNVIRYGLFVSALQNTENLSGNSLENVLAESDNLENLLITFNYETVFVQPVEFQRDITAPNILYSLTAGAGIAISGDAQKPSIRNSGVLSVNGLGGEVTITAGENVTLVEENGVLTIKSTDTNTDTKLSEAEVEEYVFDGESTGEFTDVQIGDVLLSSLGTSSTTSGSSLVGVYQGNLTELSGTDVQEIIENIDATLASLGTSSHAAVTFAGSVDYLTLTDQQITLNQIDLTTDVTGELPILNGGTGSNTALGARSNLGLGAGDTVGFGNLGIGTTSPTYPLSIVADNPASVTMSMQNTSNTGWTSIRYYNDIGAHSASFGYGNTGAAKFRDIAYIQTNSPTTPISLATNSTDRLFVTGTGDIGVGTTIPSAKFQVIGSILGTSLSDGTATITGGIITGTGSGLTGLNASSLSSGTVPTARVSGSYTGITGLGTVTTGTWQGTAIGAAYLDSSLIAASEIDTYAELNTIVSDVTLTHSGLIDTSAELAGIVGDETGSGNIVFSNSPTFTGTLELTDSSTTKLNFDSLGSSTWGNVVTSTNFAESTGIGFGIGGNSSMTNIPRFVLNADNSYVGWAMRPGDGGTLGSTNGDGNLMVRGNLGVGTSNPGALLDVQGAAQFGSGNVDLINSTGKIAAINTTYFASVDGSALTNLNASNLASGTVASARISGSYTGITGLGTVAAGTWQGTAINSTYLDTNLILSSEIDTSAELAAILTNETGSGALVFGTSPTLTTPNIGAANGTSLSVTGALTSGGVVTGTGSGLTGLNASNLSSGTVASARISGSYTGITGVGTISAGTWQGTDISATYLDSTLIQSTEIDTSAEIAAIVTNETGSGALVFGTSPTLTTPNIGAATGSSLALSTNGTASAPAINWSSDTNMGIYRVNTDQLGFSTNGTVRMYLNSWGGLAVGDLDNFLLGPNVGNRLYVGGASSSDSANERLTNIEYINTRSDTGSFPQRSLEVTYSNEGSDAPGSKGYAVYGSASNLQTNATGGAIHESYGVYGAATGNTNGSSYAYGVYCTASGADNNYCGGNQAWTQFSDRRVKKNISTIDGALDILMNLRGVRYQRTDDGSEKTHIGFIAQEVLPYLPEVVSYFASDDRYTMSYGDITALTVNAVKEQNEIVLTNKSNIQKADIRLNETGEVLKIVNTQTQKLLADQNNVLNQINFEKSIQDTRMASQAASLQTVNDQVKAIEKMTNDTNAVVAGLQDRVSQIESLFAMQTATDAASIAENTSDVLGMSDQANLERLSVTGDTNVNNLGITGDITAGLLSIKGFDDALATPSAIISTLSGPLKIQDQSSGNLEIMSGKVLIDTDGNVNIRGSITVKKLNIEETDEAGKSIGEGIITSGQNEVIVNTTSVTDKSKIFVTGKNVIKTPIVVVEKIPGVSFKVRVAESAESDVLFDWLIVN